MQQCEPSAKEPADFGLSRLNFDDIDRQAQCLTDYDQKYQQLSKGQFDGQFTTALLGSELGLYFEKLNQVLDQTGTVPKDQYLALILMNTDAPCKVNGRDFSCDDIFLAGPGASFHSMSRPGTHFCVVSIERSCFEAAQAALTPDHRTGLIGLGNSFQYTNKSHAHALRHLVEQAVVIFEAMPDLFAVPRARAGLRALLTETISNQVTFNKDHHLTVAKFHRRNNLKAFRKACSFIHATRGLDISVMDLCRHVGMSRRALEYSFQTCIEQSPNAYLRLVRLNEIRRTLLTPESAECSIGDIAAQWGVWHLSRFAQYYQTQFGELPSQTRKRLA